MKQAESTLPAPESQATRDDLLYAALCWLEDYASAAELERHLSRGALRELGDILRRAKELTP